MSMFAGLDVVGKRTAVCVVEEKGKIIWQGMVDTHPEMICGGSQAFPGRACQGRPGERAVHADLHRSLVAMGHPMVCMDARRAADAIRSRRIKSDKADAWALAEMLRTGWFTAVHVKSVDSHPHQDIAWGTRPTGEDQAFARQSAAWPAASVGVRLPSRAGTKTFPEAAYQAIREDGLVRAAIGARFWKLSPQSMRSSPN